jgi:type I restriction enzyme M protein
MPKRHAIGASSTSVLARIEEIVLATSGADPFELVVALVAARLAAIRGARGGVRARARWARAEWPWLGLPATVDAPDALVARIDALLDKAQVERDAEGLDALFEQLVTRVAKGEKGQFWTPRHVVEFAVRGLLLRKGEHVADPACGSGAFLAHARAIARVKTSGYDVDPRAVRVAGLLALATGRDPASIARADTLRESPAGAVDAIATNPPFAGRADATGFELADLVRSPERDVLFVERCLQMLRPGGRLAVILPHGKLSGQAWLPFRRWLVDRARVFAVVSFPSETFRPHTAQRAALVLAKKRRRIGASPRERMFFAVSDRAGKDAGGEPIARAGADLARDGWRALDHDLDAIQTKLLPFLKKQGFQA